MIPAEAVEAAAREPDYLILSGGGDLFSPQTDPVVFQQFISFVTEKTEALKWSRPRQ